MTYLTGAGHFGVGFLFGTMIALILMVLFRKRLSVQLYSPFIPFLLGVWAAIPYTLHYSKTCDFSVIYYLFVFYPMVHCHSGIAAVLSNLYLVALICGFIYVFFLWRYIGLAKKVRRRGWSN